MTNSYENFQEKMTPKEFIMGVIGIILMILIGMGVYKYVTTPKVLSSELLESSSSKIEILTEDIIYSKLVNENVIEYMGETGMYIYDVDVTIPDYVIDLAEYYQVGDYSDQKSTDIRFFDYEIPATVKMLYNDEYDESYYSADLPITIIGSLGWRSDGYRSNAVVKVEYGEELSLLFRVSSFFKAIGY